MTKTKLEHKFFHYALSAFLSHFSASMQPYRDTIDAPFPVLIANTGDEVFLATMIFKTEKQKKTLVNHNPRLTFSIGGLAKNSDQLTSPWEFGRFLQENAAGGFAIAKASNVRRIPVNFTLSYEIAFTNVDQYLKFADVMLTVIEQEQVFEFQYAGMIHRGSYAISTENYDGTANLNLAHDSEKRHRILSNALEVRLQFPAYDVYASNGNTPEVLDENNRMLKLVHNVYFDGDKQLVARTIIDKSSNNENIT